MYALQFDTAASGDDEPIRPIVSSEERLRIALVSQEYPPETAHGGIASQAYAKARGLARRGHDVIVVSATRTGRYVDERIDGVRVIRLPGIESVEAAHNEPASWLARSLQVEGELARLHAAEPIDVVEFAEYGAEGYFHVINRRPWHHIPTVVHLHGPLTMLAHTIGWPDKDSDFYHVGTFMEEQLVRRADGVYSSSDCSADWCARQYGINRDEVPRLHLGVDTTHFRPLKVTRDHRPTIIFVGRIARSKGVDTLVEAACTVAHRVPHLRLLLLGRDDDGLGLQLVRTATKAGFPDLVELGGFVGHDDLPSALSRADVFAAPSLYEGGPGFVYLEAMACGVPVIATSGSGASEVVISDENGVLIEPGNTAALANAIAELLLDDERRLRLGRDARAWVIAEAEREACLDRLEKLYLAVANGERLSR